MVFTECNAYSCRITSFGELHEIEQEDKAEQLKTESLRGRMGSDVEFWIEDSCCRIYSLRCPSIVWFTHFSDNRVTLRRRSSASMMLSY